MPQADSPFIRVLRVAAAIIAIVFGVGMVGLALFVGGCDFAGGRCPQDPDPIFDSDTFRFGAFGTFIAVSIPMWLHTPTWRRFAIALAVGGAAGLVVGLMVRSSAAG